VPVPCFLLFLYFRKATQEIFSELDKTKPEPPISPRHETKTEGVTSQDFIKFWGNFFAFIPSALIENSQGFKTFEFI
jgi:hypothetical protein